MINLFSYNSLVQQFNQYKDIFKPQFLQYNGDNQIISLQYQLRTLKNYSNREEYLEEFLQNYLENPIQIPSNEYTVQIYDQQSMENLAESSTYFERIGNWFFFKMSNLNDLNSDFITIVINSNFKINVSSIVKSRISKQPKNIDRYKLKYELESFLQSSNFPERLQFLNVPITFPLVLNDFINNFIKKKFLIALKKWYNLERKGNRGSRKNIEYRKMIKNRYDCTPIEFSERIQQCLDEILGFIEMNLDNIISIENIEGELIPEIPRGYRLSNQTGVAHIELNFKAKYDQTNLTSNSYMTFDFKWMKKIFQKYFQ